MSVVLDWAYRGEAYNNTASEVEWAYLGEAFQISSGTQYSVMMICTEGLLLNTKGVIGYAALEQSMEAPKANTFSNQGCSVKELTAESSGTKAKTVQYFDVQERTAESSSVGAFSNQGYNAKELTEETQLAMVRSTQGDIVYMLTWEESLSRNQGATGYRAQSHMMGQSDSITQANQGYASKGLMVEDNLLSARFLRFVNVPISAEEQSLGNVQSTSAFRIPVTTREDTLFHARPVVGYASFERAVEYEGTNSLAAQGFQFREQATEGQNTSIRALQGFVIRLAEHEDVMQSAVSVQAYQAKLITREESNAHAQSRTAFSARSVTAGGTIASTKALQWELVRGIITTDGDGRAASSIARQASARTQESENISTRSQQGYPARTIEAESGNVTAKANRYAVVPMDAVEEAPISPKSYLLVTFIVRGIATEEQSVKALSSTRYSERMVAREEVAGRGVGNAGYGTIERSEEAPVAITKVQKGLPAGTLAVAQQDAFLKATQHYSTKGVATEGASDRAVTRLGFTEKIDSTEASSVRSMTNVRSGVVIRGVEAPAARIGTNLQARVQSIAREESNAPIKGTEGFVVKERSTEHSVSVGIAHTGLAASMRELEQMNESARVNMQRSVKVAAEEQATGSARPLQHFGSTIRASEQQDVAAHALWTAYTHVTGTLGSAGMQKVNNTFKLSAWSSEGTATNTSFWTYSFFTDHVGPDAVVVPINRVTREVAVNRETTELPIDRRTEEIKLDRKTLDIPVNRKTNE